VFHMFLKDKSGKDDDIVLATRLGIIFITSQLIQASSGFHVDWHEPLKSAYFQFSCYFATDSYLCCLQFL
jgi:Fe-S cluster assembly iron-binding protein IscA